MGRMSHAVNFNPVCSDTPVTSVPVGSRVFCGVKSEEAHWARPLLLSFTHWAGDPFSSFREKTSLLAESLASYSRIDGR